MTLQAKVVTYAANTVTGDQTLAGAGFTPKAAIVSWNSITTAADTFVDSAMYGMAWTDGTNHRNVVISTEDAAGFSDTYKSYSDTTFIRRQVISSGAINGSATFSSFNSDGMVINWSDASPAAFMFHVLYLGGADLTNVKVGSFNPDNDLGASAETGVGFQPDMVIIMGCRNNVEETVTAHAALQIGAATSSSAQWATAFSLEDNRNTSDTWQYYDHDTFLSCILPDTGGFTGTGDFTSMDSDGFTINMTEAPALADILYYYIAFKGGSYVVGNNTEPGGTGNQTITTNKDTKAVMIFGVDTGTEAEPAQANAVWSVGMGTSTVAPEMACNVFEDLTAVGTSQSASRYETDSIYLNMTSAATATDSTIDDEASLASLSSTGFVLNWSNIGQARPFRYITFGDAAEAPAAPTELAIVQSHANIHQMFDKRTPNAEGKGTIFG